MEGMNWTDVVLRIIEFVFGLVTLILPPAIFMWLRSKTKNADLKAAYDEAEFVMTNVVAALGADLVQGWKEKNADGKLTPEEIALVTTRAVESFKSDLSNKAYALIDNNAADMQLWIVNLIKSKVEAQK